MDVAVGSRNPVKYQATAAVFENANVEAVSVDPGVSEQPLTTAETIEGARKRARRALDAEKADLGVGIEGGVARVEGEEGWYLTMWAAVADDTRLEIGSGPRIRLPSSIAGELQAGAELGPLLDERLGTEGIKKERGAAGLLTENAIDRQSSLEHAVAAAMAPIRSSQYDHSG
ncbi:MAG: DUF84 family protein [Halodesulfurarchaeum sp.]